MRVAYEDRFHELEPLLAHVEKPSRYIDHEWGAIRKDDADYRCCLVYPDVYEVGLPNQGLAILYQCANAVPGVACERAYVPWIDMADAMRAAGVPMLSLEGAAPGTTDWVSASVPPKSSTTRLYTTGGTSSPARGTA